jgi:hypothetical protein
MVLVAAARAGFAFATGAILFLSYFELSARRHCRACAEIRSGRADGAPEYDALNYRGIAHGYL